MLQRTDRLIGLSLSRHRPGVAAVPMPTIDPKQAVPDVPASPFPAGVRLLYVLAS